MAEPKGLPFAEKPEIEPEPGSWADINRQGQVVHDPKTSITGDVEGPVLSGSFNGPVSVGEGDSVDTPLSRRVFIIGPNASGKSNFLDAFRFLRDVAKSEGGGLQKGVVFRRR